jgi:hypothetical protein
MAREERQPGGSTCARVTSRVTSRGIRAPSSARAIWSTSWTMAEARSTPGCRSSAMPPVS